MATQSDTSTAIRRSSGTWRRAFLSAFRHSGNVSAAAELADVSRQHVYRYALSHPDFAAQLTDAREEAADRLEAEARHRAADGVEDYVLANGRPVWVWIDEAGKVLADVDALGETQPPGAVDRAPLNPLGFASITS